MATSAPQFYMGIAEQTSFRSKDPKRKVGAVLVSPDQRSLVTGYNGFPRGIRDLESRLECKATKNSLMIHAELNAILNAKESLFGWSIYVNYHPCSKCALAIIQSGISHVRCPEPVDSSLARKEDFALARALFAEAELTLRYL